MSWYVHSTGQIFDANEGPVVFFHPESGDTHLLGEFAACVLQQLAAGPMTTGELVEHLAPLMEADSRDALSDSVGIVLEELVALDILSRR